MKEMKKIVLLSVIAGMLLLLAGYAIAAKPLSVVFVADYSGSMSTNKINFMENSVKIFISYMQPDDCGGYIAFGMNSVIQTPGFAKPSLLMESISGNGVDKTDTHLYDAIQIGFSDFYFAFQNDESYAKAFVILTDGGDGKKRGFGEKYDLDAVIKFATEEKIPIFVIGLDPGDFAEQTLKEIADETNGDYYNVRSLSLSESYVAMILRDWYNFLTQSE